MTNLTKTMRPLLTYFEEEIPAQKSALTTEYDESRMILLVDGKPACLEPGLTLAGSTKLTRVGQETVDDD